MKFLILIILIPFYSLVLPGQNLIGYKDSEIRKFMRENNKEMSLNKVKNNEFFYLKYSDSSDNQTTLFFLNADSVCRNIRIICDIAMKTQKLKELDSAYKKKAENKWIDDHNGKQYLVELRDEEWSCVITMEPMK